MAAFSDEMQKIAMEKDAKIWQTIRRAVNKPFVVGDLKRAKGWGPDEYKKAVSQLTKHEGPEYAAQMQAKADFTPLLKRTKWGQGKKGETVVSAAKELGEQAAASRPRRAPMFQPAMAMA